MAWATSVVAALVTAAAGAGTAVYQANHRPKQVQPVQAPSTNTDTEQAAANAASDRRRQLMGGGLASTILSQTQSTPTTGKTLLGS